MIENIANDPRIVVRRAGAPNPEGKCVIYWMQRAQRAADNPALNAAIEAANALRKPVAVFIGVVPFYPNANLRSCSFFVQGLPDLQEGLAKRKVGLVVRRYPRHELDKFCEEVNPCLVIGDENPMREPESWRKAYADKLRVPFWTVDADVIVPTALLKKEQYGARTIRPRIHKLLGEFLGPLANPVAHVAWKSDPKLETAAVDGDLLAGFPMDSSVAPVSDFRAGTKAALGVLQRFLTGRLKGYDENRNQPATDGTSQLSPYLHYGHIGPHTIALAVKNSDAPREDLEAFLEQMIVRRELSINFVKFNRNYDRLACAEPWAVRTLKEHRRDEREYTYTESQLENAETHDPLWNAAQQQMVVSGWMHGYLRMYWGKKILEWTRAPEEAFAIAVRLNDKYELDGRDPNGYTGIAWAIAGKHDRAWGPERSIYGKVRYMSYASTSRKFDSKGYIARIQRMLAKGANS